MKEDKLLNVDKYYLVISKYYQEIMFNIRNIHESLIKFHVILKSLKFFFPKIPPANKFIIINSLLLIINDSSFRYNLHIKNILYTDYLESFSLSTNLGERN